MTRSIVQSNLGIHPVWYLTDQLENSTISFMTFITTDVLYSLVGVNRRTVFDVRAADLPPGHEPGLRVHFGIPAAVLSALAQINNLTADPTVMETAIGTALAAEIEDALHNWRPELRSGLSASDLTETVAVQAMWCEVCLIHTITLYSYDLGRQNTHASTHTQTRHSIPSHTE
jgi:hypothetical protein